MFSNTSHVAESDKENEALVKAPARPEIFYGSRLN